MNILAALQFYFLFLAKRYRMPPSGSQGNNHAKILDYWNRRRHLREEEWKDFYQLTVPILMNTQLPPEFADRTKRRDLADMFFAEKIFLNAAISQAGPLKTVYALHTYLKRFVLDIQRQSSHFTAAEEISEDLPSESESSHCHNVPPVAYTQVLAEAGIDLDKAAQSADEFLNELDTGEAAYLRYNSCADQEVTEPISRIAKRLALGAGFHFKAKSLGITRSKGETYVGYEKTKIGRWLLSVGAKLNEEWQEELAVLLTLLCLKVHERGADPA